MDNPSIMNLINISVNYRIELRILDELKSALERIPGPLPSFSLVHAVLMLLILEDGSVGRKRLSSLMGIGEGSVRSLIRRLKEIGLIDVDREGCSLTEKGKEAVKKIRKVMSGLTELKLRMVDSATYAILLRGLEGKINVLKMRDEAVRAGGEGAVILVQLEGTLMFPETMEPLMKYHSEDERILRDSLRPSNGDIIIIGLGKTVRESKVAAISVALSALQAQ